MKFGASVLYDIGLIIVGLAGLLVGGELLVRGATVIAKTFGMSSLIIGLTVVSIGTSAPELAICLDSAFKDKPEI
ncbi:sodium:calcium antiporter, partial [Pirellulaceae bacterium]|nr:sodium:calcium antiporter [Pirellulaceae bacterium]